MDAYRIGQILNNLGNGIKNGIITEVEDTVEFFSRLLGLGADAILGIIKVMGTVDPASGEFSQALRPFIAEGITKEGSADPAVNDFLAGLRGQPRPTDEVEAPSPDEIDAANEIRAGGAAGMPGGPGGATTGASVIKADVQALSADAIDSILRNAVQMGQIPGAVVQDGQVGRLGFEGEIQPLGPISEEEIIRQLIAVAPDIKFLGFANRGYPLGYKELQKGSNEYGEFPVYLPDMSDSLFGRSGVPETYIGKLQDKLIRAGYLRTSFQPEVFDNATKAAVEEAMAEHNREGRVPPIPEVAGSLLDFLGLGQEETQYAWDSVRNKEVQDFFFNELDKDVSSAEERRFSDVLTEVPEFSEATAGYLMLNTLQQYFPGGSITLDNIRNATTLVNNVSANVAKDVNKLRKEAELRSIEAGSAAIQATADIRKVREANPTLSDAELKLMYPELFDREARVVGELGAFGAGQAERQGVMFQQKLGTAIQNLIQPELDFLDKQQTFDRATQNLLAANRGLNSLERGAPT